MAAVVGSLLVKLAADSGPLSTALRTAGYDVSAFESKTGKSLASADRQFSTHFASMGKSAGNAIVSLGRSGLAGAIAGLGASLAVGAIRETTRGIAELGDEAKRAGVDVKSFQELKFVAEQNRIGVDALTDGLKELNLRADEFIATGGGSAADAFQRIGYGAADLREKLKDPSALFTEIIGKLGQLDRAAQIRVADELFGGSGGEQFVQLIAQGEEGIKRTIEQARSLGVVMSEDLIAKAADLDTKFSAIATTVSTGLKTAIVEAATALQGFIDKFNSTQQQQAATLEQRQRDLGAERVQIENSLLSNPNPARGDTRRQRLAAIASEEASVVAEQVKRQPIVVPTSTPALPPQGLPTKASSGGSRSSTVSDAEKERSAVAALITELVAERDALGQTDVQRRVSAELRKAGAAATDAERIQIAALVEQVEAEGDALERVKDQWATAEGLTKDFAGSLIGDLTKGVSAVEAITNAFGRLGEQLLSMAANQAIESLFSFLIGSIGGGVKFDGIGTGAGAFSNIAKLAAGGPVVGPGSGTSDSVLANLSNGEFVVNASSARAFRPLLESINSNRPSFARGGFVPPSMPGRAGLSGLTKGIGRSSAPAVSNNYTIDARGAQRGVGEEIRDALMAYDKSLPDRMQQISRDPRKR